MENWILLFDFACLIVFWTYWKYVRCPYEFPKEAHIVPNTALVEKILGQAPNIFKEEGGAPHLRWLAEANRAGKWLVGYDFLLGRRRVMILHPLDVQYLLTGQGARLIVKPREYKNLERILGRFGLVTLRDESVHSTQRRFVSPAFSAAPLQAIANTIVTKHSATFDAELTEATSKKEGEMNQSRDLAPFFDQLALRIVSEASFRQLTIDGIRIDQEFSRAVSSPSYLDFVPLGRHIPTERNRLVKSAVRSLRQASSKICDAVRAEMRENEKVEESRDAASVEPPPLKRELSNGGTSSSNAGSGIFTEINPAAGAKTLIDVLLRNANLTNDEITDHSTTFLLAGHETTSKALTWTAYFLATHPKVQETLFEEIVSAVGLHEQPSLETVKSLNYLQMVVYESMRLQPPVPMTIRQVDPNSHNAERVVLPFSKATLVPGTEILISAFALHRNPLTWGEDAAEFRPERWEENSALRQSLKSGGGMNDLVGTFGYIPFLAGKRNCIGKDFALNEIYITIAAMVRSFRLGWPEGGEHPKRRFAVTNRPREPILLHVTPRTE